jgi:hypothetical protein
MSVLETKCRNCGVLLSFGAIEGYCRRCLAGVAFAGEDSGVSIERRLGAHELLEVIGEGGMGRRGASRGAKRSGPRGR